MPTTDLDLCLQEHIALLHTFLALTQQEHDLLLTQFDVDSLASFTQQKNQLLIQIQQLDEQRNQHLQALGLPTQAQQLHTISQQHPELHDSISQLLALSAQARTQNENNGVLIHEYLTSNQQALDTLAALAGKNDFYNAQGRSNPPAGSSTSFKV